MSGLLSYSKKNKYIYIYNFTEADGNPENESRTGLVKIGSDKLKSAQTETTK